MGLYYELHGEFKNVDLKVNDLRVTYNPFGSIFCVETHNELEYFDCVRDAITFALRY